VAAATTPVHGIGTEMIVASSSERPRAFPSGGAVAARGTADNQPGREINSLGIEEIAVDEKTGVEFGQAVTLEWIAFQHDRTEKIVCYGRHGQREVGLRQAGEFRERKAKQITYLAPKNGGRRVGGGRIGIAITCCRWGAKPNSDRARLQKPRSLKLTEYSSPLRTQVSNERESHVRSDGKVEGACISLKAWPQTKACLLRRS